MASIDRLTSTALPVAWHVSTRSGNGSGNCVEAGPVRDGSGRFAVRDSLDRSGPVLLYAAADWGTFLTGLRTDRLA